MPFTRIKKMLRSAYEKHNSHRNYRKFVVLGHARTGSNYLLGGIKNSASVRMHHEEFAGHKREIGQGFDEILSRLFSPEVKQIKAVGFKLFYYHLTEDEWEKLMSDADIAFIHLTRRNYLRTIVSLDIAFKTKQWGLSADRRQEQKPKTITLDPATLVARIEEIKRYEEVARERLQGRQVLELVYEELVENPTQEFERIGGFLGIKGVSDRDISYVKQNPEPLENLIINYDEVYALLVETKFAAFLNE